MDGLYRISGKANDLLKLKKEFDNGVYRTLSVYWSVQLNGESLNSHTLSCSDILSLIFWFFGKLRRSSFIWG